MLGLQVCTTTPGKMLVIFDVATNKTLKLLCVCVCVCVCVCGIEDGTQELSTSELHLQPIFILYLKQGLSKLLASSLQSSCLSLLSGWAHTHPTAPSWNDFTYTVCVCVLLGMEPRGILSLSYTSSPFLFFI